MATQANQLLIFLVTMDLKMCLVWMKDIQVGLTMPDIIHNL